MKITRRLSLLLSLTLTVGGGLSLIGCGDDGGSGGNDATKIAFLVKQPEEPWFQTEWRFADEAANDYGFELVKLAVPDGEGTLTAIDNIAAQGVDGFIICTPDVKLGPAIKARADSYGLKLMTVDDRLVDGDGNPIDSVPHLGISAKNIGRLVGEALWQRMQAQSWKVEETGLCLMTFDELATAKERTDGAVEALIEAGFPEDRIFRAPNRKPELSYAYDAADVLLTQQPEIKNWLVAGMNDTAVIGAVRAMEGRGLSTDRIIGVGINGTDAVNEFKKSEETGLYGSILLSAKRHGYDTSEMMYRWVAEGQEPPKLTYTDGELITRETWEQTMREHGLLDGDTANTSVD